MIECFTYLKLDKAFIKANKPIPDSIKLQDDHFSIKQIVPIGNQDDGVNMSFCINFWKLGLEITLCHNILIISVEKVRPWLS